ncbi:hypothetical protein AJ78_08023 [Emergomyces pasteurianus Ep9510]|uniref:Uncharacterized protein n=1 Tax=Emergomyces pasteurianus Ep9510 TaxID=1447872 RepID=A0A1J9Q7K9_9EURO|nr:hypothetical protein AJ78_08023 [Emergomyces pasteurianus Ep9510]
MSALVDEQLQTLIDTSKKYKNIMIIVNHLIFFDLELRQELIVTIITIILHITSLFTSLHAYLNMFKMLYDFLTDNKLVDELK